MSSAFYEAGKKGAILDLKRNGVVQVNYEIPQLID